MPVGPAVEIARDVFHRLTPADRPGVIDGVAAQLLDGQLEGQARAQGGLLEQQAQVAAGQGLRVAQRSALDAAGQFEQPLDVGGGKVEIRNQTGAGRARRRPAFSGSGQRRRRTGAAMASSTEYLYTIGE